MSKSKFNKLVIAKKKPKFHFKYSTSEISEVEKLFRLKDAGYLITVIKSIEYSVSQYFLKTNQSLTIHNIQDDGDSVIVTVFKNYDYHTMTIPKALLSTGKHNYEFNIGCEDFPKIKDKSFNNRFNEHSKLKNVIYIKL